MAARTLTLSLAVVTIALASPAGAKSGTSTDAVRSAHHAIAAGDFTSAERLLTTERRIFPNRPEVLLNLAAVFAQTGRGEMANALYARVLAHEDVVMDLSADRTASAHAIAQRGLRRLAPVQTATR